MELGSFAWIDLQSCCDLRFPQYHVVVLVKTEVGPRVADLARPDQLVVGEPLGHVLQVPAEGLAPQLLAQGLALGDVAVVAQALRQRLLVVAQSGKRKVLVLTVR